MSDPSLYGIEITPRALAQLELIRKYIAEQGAPIAADHMIERLLVAIEGLRYFPMRGRPRGRGRELVVKPYLIRYRISAASTLVVVTRIRHGAQRPD